MHIYTHVTGHGLGAANESDRLCTTHDSLMYSLSHTHTCIFIYVYIYTHT